MRLVVFSLIFAIGAPVANPGFARRHVGHSPVNAADASRSANVRLAGTWKVETAAPRVLGYAVYDPAGYMGLMIQSGASPTFDAKRATPQQARSAMDSFTAYWGTFAVNEAAGLITHQTFGALSTAISGTDIVGRFAISADRLVLRPRAAEEDGRSTLIWERVPELPGLTATQRRLVGFWKLISTETRSLDGRLLSSSPGQTGFLIYTASGQVMVHMMQPYRRRNIGVLPTPDETMAAYRTYSGYFGSFTVDESKQYVVHHIAGSINSGGVGTDFQRFLEFSGNRLILKTPITRNEYGDVRVTLTWERLRD